jgi:hypothetical protein
MTTNLENLLVLKLRELDRLGEGSATITATLRDRKLCVSVQHDAFGGSSTHEHIEDAVVEMLDEKRKIEFALQNFADLLNDSVHPAFAKAMRQ